MSLEATVAMRRLVVAAIVLATLVLVSTLARADALPAPTSIQAIDAGIAAVAPAKAEPTRISYRWQLLLADTGALLGALTAPALGVRDDGVRLIAGGMFALGAPVVHAVHGHGWRATKSLALRIGLPLAGAWIGSRLQGEPDCPPDAGGFCGDARIEFGLILGASAGVLTAIIADTWLVARPRERPRRGWSPALAPTRGGATAGITGSF